jgi:amino acid transporter
MNDLEDIRPWWLKHSPWLAIAAVVLAIWFVIWLVAEIVGILMQAVAPLVVIGLVTYIVMHRGRHHRPRATEQRGSTTIFIGRGL